MLGNDDWATDGLTDWATEGLELNAADGLIEYWDEATEGLTLGIEVADSDRDGEVGREYEDGIPELIEYGEAIGELCKYGSVDATPDKIDP